MKMINHEVSQTDTKDSLKGIKTFVNLSDPLW